MGKDETIGPVVRIGPFVGIGLFGGTGPVVSLTYLITINLLHRMVVRLYIGGGPKWSWAETVMDLVLVLVENLYPSLLEQPLMTQRKILYFAHP